jgi:copper transport protein
VLLIKIGLVVAVLLVAAASRSWVQRQQTVKASALADEETLASLDRELVLAGIGVEESTVGAQSGTGFPPAGDRGAFSVPAPRGEGRGEGAAPGDDSSREPAAESPSPRELRKLRWSVLAEVVVVIAILAVTAVLVVTPPAKTVYGSTNPAADAAAASTSATVHAGPVQVRVIAGPTTPTATRELRMFVSTYDQNVRLRDVPELTGEMRLPTKGLGPLPVTFTRTAAGRFSVDSIDLPVAGQWELTLNVRVDDFNSYTGSTPVTVR